MNDIIKEMLSHYQIDSFADEKLALKEVVQEALLCSLYKAGFFQVAAFYGGTSLRIFHGLDRFSEDLDFSLLSPDPSFELAPYCPFIEKDLGTLGLRFKVSKKQKKNETGVKTAFAKGNLKELILEFFPSETSSLHPDELITVKFEVDIMPPAGAEYETKYRLLPSYYGAKLFRLPFLFAGKIGALLSRSYANRVKGRDLFDYLFYLSRGVKANAKYLAGLLARSTSFVQETITLDELQPLLFARFDAIDYEMAKADVKPFIKEDSSLEIWNADFFKGVTESSLAVV